MILVLLGPPGSGKGTQAKMIEDKFNLKHLSTGDLLRANVRESTQLGIKAKGYMDSGALVPDDVILGMMSEKVAMLKQEKGVLLDGFPRTIVQAESLDKMLSERKLKIDIALLVDVPDDEVVKRLGGRRQCKSCGWGCHLEFQPPRTENVCNVCGGDLYLRDDDRPQTVKERLVVYRNQTSPLIDYYKSKGNFISIDGTGTSDEVFNRISNVINGVFK